MHRLLKIAIASLVISVSNIAASSDEPVVRRVSDKYFDIDYGNVRLLIDCSLRNAVLAKYTAHYDRLMVSKGRPTFSDIAFESSLPSECNPASTSMYAGAPNTFYRQQTIAHPTLLAVNEVRDALKIVNIVPVTVQTANTLRDINVRIACKAQAEKQVTVFSGPVYTADRDKDFFFKTHGQLTPNGIFIVGIAPSGDLMSVLVPNHVEATAAGLSEWIKPVSAIEQLLDVKIPLNNDIKDAFPNLWSRNCDLTSRS